MNLINIVKKMEKEIYFITEDLVLGLELGLGLGLGLRLALWLSLGLQLVVRVSFSF